jgi:hypothetical protein
MTSIVLVTFIVHITLLFCYDTYILFLGLRVVYMYAATYDPQYQVAVT